jgi:hypothetical protein
MARLPGQVRRVEEEEDGRRARDVRGARGRSKRRTGRDQQFNLKVTPAFKAEVLALAKARDVGAAELLETILAEWKAANG